MGREVALGIASASRLFVIRSHVTSPFGARQVTASEATPVPPTATDTAVPPTVTPSKPLGDVNQDDEVNSVDATLIKQFDAGIISSLAGFDNGDVNLDGFVNTVDAALILQFEVGIIDSLPPIRTHGARVFDSGGLW